MPIRKTGALGTTAVAKTGGRKMAGGRAIPQVKKRYSRIMNSMGTKMVANGLIRIMRLLRMITITKIKK